VVARRAEGDGRVAAGLGAQLLAAGSGRPRDRDRGRSAGPPAGGRSSSCSTPRA
jgi:hypothetical protein